jgi:hypothetical protein
VNISKKVLLLLFIGVASILSLVTSKNIQAKNPEVTFCAPTKKEAFCLAMYYIRKLPWYIQNKCPVDLPEHEVFKELYKNPEAILSYDENYLRNIFYTEIYDITAFDKGLEKICKTYELVNAALKKIAAFHENWGFKLMPQYEIILTLYGPGGNYNSVTGQVIIKTTTDGTFSCWQNNVATTIIHEIVHIGIEENIVHKYKLTHNEKERLVDLICSNYLKEFLPNYKLQERGDINIDPFILRRQNTQMNGRRTLAYSAEVATKAGRSLGEVGFLAMKNFACYHAASCVERFISEKVIFENLPAAIEDYVTQYPR